MDRNEPSPETPIVEQVAEASTSRRSSSEAHRGPFWRGNFFTRQLPLQSETTVFILANALDVFVTYILLNFEGFRESNSVANFFLAKYGFKGMVYFKFALVAFVTVIAQIIATHRPRTARYLLNVGSAVVLMVVFYSLWLFVNHSGLFGVEGHPPVPQLPQ